MDLSSYLLKPIQRISKYNLLLQDMEWECKGQSTREAELKSAREVVRFQLRHGNDLLAMDDIQDCDVRNEYTNIPIQYFTIPTIINPIQ